MVAKGLPRLFEWSSESKGKLGLRVCCGDGWRVTPKTGINIHVLSREPLKMRFALFSWSLISSTIDQPCKGRAVRWRRRHGFVAGNWELKSTNPDLRPPKCHIRACLSARADV